MKIVYIANTRIPTEKAHGWQICKMCEQFGKMGNKTELWLPMRENEIKEDIFSFYGLEKCFKIEIFDGIDWVKAKKYFGKTSFYFQKIFFFFRLVFQKIDKDAMVYSRDPEIVWLFGLRGRKTIFSAHNWPQSKNFLYKLLLKNADKIICNSYGTEKKFKGNGFKNTCVFPNGVDLDKFDFKEDSEKLKDKLGVPRMKNIVMYAGHLYEWKGISVIMEIAEKMRLRDDIVIFVLGGSRKDTEKYEKIKKGKKLNNIYFCGYQTRESIPLFFKCADIFLLPNIPISEESREETSPIKMFEYMAASKPIIASALPSIKEILNDSNSILAEPGNSSAFVRAIESLLNNKEFSDKISKKAFSDALKYSWSGRAERIVDFILR